MNPFFFGTASRRLFGLYTPAVAGTHAQRAVVLCQPWGQEYLRAHRSVRSLATQLARAGVHVLRFDYFGTGDSAGEMSDGDLKGWQSDIDTAIGELKDTTGANKVGLVGLRLGATLAARVAAAKKGDVDSLVLWDPIVAGDEYLEEVRKQSVLLATMPAPPSASEEAEQVLGFDLTQKLASEIAAVDLPLLLPKLPARTLAVVSQPLASHDRIRSHATLAVEEIVSPPAWQEDKNYQ